jgi:hypothetical protein
MVRIRTIQRMETPRHPWEECTLDGSETTSKPTDLGGKRDGRAVEVVIPQQ